MHLKHLLLITTVTPLLLASCAKETFDSTCLGFSKSHWTSFTNEQSGHKELCSCVHTELKKGDVSEQGVEALRSAMSAAIVMRNRFESELNKAEKDKNLSSEERETYDLALGKCLKGSSVEEEKVDSMLDQFKALQ